MDRARNGHEEREGWLTIKAQAGKGSLAWAFEWVERRLRKDARLTGKELAQRAGVAQPTISRMETGRLLPTPETADATAAYCHIT